MAVIAVGTERGLWGLDLSGGGQPVAPVFADRRVSALSERGGVLWALFDGQELWRVPLTGGQAFRAAGDGNERSWSRVARLEGLSSACVASTRAGVLVGTGEARLLRLEGEALKPLPGFDTADGRAAWYTPWGGPPETRSITGNDHAIFVNVHVGGVLRSSDGGTSWEPTIDIHADVHRVLAHPRIPGRIYAACPGGLAVSDDDGDSWTIHADGLHARYCRAVAVIGDRVLVSASQGPGGQRSALYRGAVDGSGLERCRTGLPDWFDGNIDSLCLDASSAAGLAAFGTATGSVYASVDEGTTWELAAEGLPPVTCLAVT